MTSIFVIIVSEIVPKYMPNICILQCFEIEIGHWMKNEFKGIHETYLLQDNCLQVSR